MGTHMLLFLLKETQSWEKSESLHVNRRADIMQVGYLGPLVAHPRREDSAIFVTVGINIVEDRNNSRAVCGKVFSWPKQSCQTGAENHIAWRLAPMLGNLDGCWMA